MWLGHRNINQDMWLIIPNEDAEYEKIENGKRLKHIMACWYTNLDNKKRHEDLIMYRQYTPDAYPKYDNYDAINVDKVDDVPMDYYGVMGVPITFMDRYNPEQFEIIDCKIPFLLKEDALKIGLKMHRTNTIQKDGKTLRQLYWRIFIKRKQGN